MTRRQRLRRYVSGVYLKAHTAFYTAGGVTAVSGALEGWKQTGHLTGGAVRGVVAGMVTGTITAVAVAAVPNDEASVAEPPDVAEPVATPEVVAVEPPAPPDVDPL